MLSLMLLASALAPTLMTPPRIVEASTIYNPFNARFRTEDFGDITFVANSLMTCSTATGALNAANCAAARAGSAAVSLTNNNYNMVGLDIDADPATDNSSSAQLNLPPGSTVLFAGLYWGGFGGDNSNPTNKAPRSTVKFSVPGTSTYATLTATTVYSAGAGTNAYHAFLDVTALVPVSATGTYTLANAQLYPNASGAYGGWAMAVVYRDPNGILQNLSVFDGFAYVDSAGAINVPINGFLTPQAGVVNAEVGVVAYDGDRTSADSGVGFNGQTLSNALNPSNDGFNSTVSTDGRNVISRSNPYTNSFGFDADLFSADGILANNQTSTTIRMASNSEVYYLGLVTSAIKIFKPVIPSAVKSQVGPVSGVVQPGDIITYNISISNIGTTNTVKTIMSDAIPSGTTYVPGSLRIDSGQAGTTGAYSDAVTDDRAEYNGTTVLWRVGQGSGNTTGGQLGYIAGNGVSNTNSYSNSASVSFAVRVNDGLTAGRVITNKADFSYGSVSAPGAIYTGTGNTVQAIVASANLAISKSASPSPATAGQQVTYTLTVQNSGPQAANTVTVTDNLPAGLTFVSCASDAGGACGGIGSSRVITFTQLAVGASAMITLVTTLADNAASGSLLPNTVNVSARTPDPVATNNSAQITTTVQSVADMAISKSASAAQVVVGDKITFTLQITNSGPSVAANVVVTDVLPANMAYFACSSTGGGACGGSGLTRTVSFVSLPVGGTASVTLVATAVADGAINNTVAIGTASIDPVAGNNSAGAASDVLVPRIGAAKSVGAITNNGDGTYTAPFTLVVRNMGETALSNVQLADALGTTFPGPAAFAVVPASISATNGTINTGFTGIAPNDTLLSGGDTLALGSALTLTFSVVVTPGTNLGPYSNTVIATAIDPIGNGVTDQSQNGANPDPDSDGNPGNNNVVTPIVFAEDPRIGAAKRVVSTVNNGDGTYDVTYALTLENLGNIVLRNVQVRDALTTTFGAPAVYAVISAPSGAGLTGNPTFNGDTDQKVLAGIDSLNAGVSRTLQFVVRVTPRTNLGPYTNSATASGTSPAGARVSDDSVDGADPDSDNDNNANNNSAPTPVLFTEAPAIGVSKIAARPVNNGDGSYTTVYTVVVKNIGNVVLSNVQATDDMVATFAGSVSYNVQTAPVGAPLAVNLAFDGTSDTKLLAAGQSLAVGQLTTVTFAMRTVPGANPGPYVNQAVGSGVSPAVTTVKDLSDDSSPPDPDGDGDAGGLGESDGTSVIFTASPKLGVSKSAVAAVNNHDGTYDVTYVITAANLGDVPLNNVQLNDVLSETFLAPVTINSVAVSAVNATANAGFNGVSDTALFKTGTSLPVGQSAIATLTVRVTPGTALGPHSNSASGSGISSVGGGALSDTSTDGATPDPDGDGDPNNNSEPTPVTFTEAPAVVSAKRVTALNNNQDGTYTAFYAIQITNTGDVPLAGVQITDDLQSVFAATSWALVGPPAASGATANSAFTGAANKNLLAGTDTLAHGASATVNVAVRFSQGTNVSLIDNIAIASGTGPAGTPANGPSNPAAIVYPRLGMAKSVGNVVHLGGGQFRATYVFTLTNTGTEVLKNVYIKDDMAATFGAVPFVVASAAGFNLTPNPNYDSVSDYVLNDANSDYLDIGASGIITLEVDFKPGTETGPFDNKAYAGATGGVSNIGEDR